MSSRSRRRSHRVKHKHSEKRRHHKHRTKKREYIPEKELYYLAQKSLDEQILRELMATVVCHGLSRNGLRRARKRQDFFLSLKTVMLHLQTLCALMVALLAVLVFIRVKETQSVFYSTQIFIESVLMFACFFTVMFESAAVRCTLMLAFSTAFFLNIIQLTYYSLFDKDVVDCQRYHEDHWSFSCLSQHPPFNHHYSYIVVLLTLLHLVALIVAVIHQYCYTGTISHLMEIAREVGFTACLTHLNQERKRKVKHRRSETTKHKKSDKSIGATVNVSELPVGTVLSAERSSAYKFKGNVQPGGTIIGSGQEAMTESLGVQPPNKKLTGKHIRVTRHVMVDTVGSKQKKGAVIAPKAKKHSSKGSTGSLSSRIKGKQSLNVPNVVQTGIPMTMMPDRRRGDIHKVDFDSTEFNSLRQMKPIGSPRSYISSKSKSIRRRKAE